VVPITINNSWKMVRFGAFPMGLGNSLKFTIHKPLKVSEYLFEELIEQTESAVVQGIQI
jgi:1-acyl-sn-glycerol-3-phosphate acyltransferase